MVNVTLDCKVQSAGTNINVEWDSKTGAIPSEHSVGVSHGHGWQS